MSETDPTSDVAALTVQLLSAYLANNTVASDDLADLIRTTRAALTEDADAAAPAAEPETFTPAVSVRKSLASSGHIISLIDGKPYKTLKRHLSSHGLTPDTYRSRYNLPATYPMVAPDYAAHRRAVAQKIGLGSRKPTPGTDETQEVPDPGELTQDAPASEAPMVEAAEAPSKPVGRGSKAAKGARGGKQPSAARAKASKAEAPPQTDESASTSAARQEDGGEAPAPSTAKRRSNKAAKPKAAAPSEAAAGEPGSTETAPDGGSEAAQPNDTGADTNKPKRGRRKASDAPDTPPVNDADNDDGEAKAASKPASKRSSDKPKKAPRMARAPKPESGMNDDTAD
jgi:predicted transcriptional regulator